MTKHFCEDHQEFMEYCIPLDVFGTTIWFCQDHIEENRKFIQKVKDEIAFGFSLAVKQLPKEDLR